MLTKRLIPCLDIQNGRVAKGITFEGVREIGDPVAMAEAYAAAGADELVFYDIRASQEQRGPFLKLIETIASRINIPFMVGGGIRSVEDIYLSLRAGADKVSINSAALKDPNLLTEGAKRFGAQCIVLSMDVRLTANGYRVFEQGGMVDTGISAMEWAERAATLGAGELVINAIHQDGVQSGYDISLTKAIRNRVSIPVIASGGAGQAAHFLELFQEDAADGALAASVFHYDLLRLPDLKNMLSQNGIPMRCTP